MTEKLQSNTDALLDKLEKEGKIEIIETSGLNVGLSEEELLEIRITQANNKKEILKDKMVYGPDSCLINQENKR